MKIVSALSVAALGLLMACAAPTAEEAGLSAVAEPVILNDACPFMGSEVDPEHSVPYGDGAVAFCCGGCVNKWNKMSDEEKAAALAD